MVYFKSILVSLFIVAAFFGLYGQGKYTLEDAILDGKNNSPSANIYKVSSREKELRNRNADSKYLPQVNMGGQATYQSETTGLDISFPGVAIPRLSKDQYKLQADISQSVWDGGLVRAQKAVNETAAAMETAQAEAELEAVTEQVIQTYFGILEADANAGILSLKGKDLQVAKKRLEVGVANGAVLRADLRRLEAEELTLRQREAELQSVRRKLIQSLGILTGRDLETNVQLPVPSDIAPEGEDFGSKPAIRLFALQEAQLDNARKSEIALSRPKVQLFGQAGYGKPGLNFLKNQFDFYWLGGLRMQWNLGHLYTTKRDAQLTAIQKEKSGIRKQNYDRQLRLRLAALRSDIDRLSEVVATDGEIISLRAEIRKSAAVQYENGSKAIAEYIDVINDENEAMIVREVHWLQYLRSVYLYNLTAGSH